MSGSDQVKSEAVALRTLRGAVTSYAEQLRDAMAAARRDADALAKRAEETARTRKADLDRALNALRQAEAALARCRDERQAAALRGEVTAKRHQADERRQLYGYAQQAVSVAGDARSDLLKTIQVLELVVSENSSVAAHALADLEGKLAAIDLRDSGSPGARAMRGGRGVLVGGAIFVGTVIDAGHVAHFAQTIVDGGESTDGHPATSQEIRSEQLSSDVEHLAESDIKDRETRAEHPGQP